MLSGLTIKVTLEAWPPLNTESRTAIWFGYYAMNFVDHIIMLDYAPYSSYITTVACTCINLCSLFQALVNQSGW